MSTAPEPKTRKAIYTSDRRFRLVSCPNRFWRLEEGTPGKDWRGNDCIRFIPLKRATSFAAAFGDLAIRQPKG